LPSGAGSVPVTNSTKARIARAVADDQERGVERGVGRGQAVDGFLDARGDLGPGFGPGGAVRSSLW
jgi:hypothetical protein